MRAIVYSGTGADIEAETAIVDRWMRVVSLIQGEEELDLDLIIDSLD